MLLSNMCADLRTHLPLPYQLGLDSGVLTLY